jgi:Thioredoxin domain
MEKIKIEVQYFEGCPNSESVLNMVRKYVNETGTKFEYREILVDTDEAAKKYNFRGSPTIQVNGNDIEGLKENETPSLSCRYYPNGLPTENDLINYMNALCEGI